MAGVLTVTDTEDKVCHSKIKVLSFAARGMMYTNLSSICKIVETWAGFICDVTPVFVCVSLVCVVCVCTEVQTVVFKIVQTVVFSVNRDYK